jgi:3-oxoacyl-[acyl-carrier protein] reductase
MASQVDESMKGQIAVVTGAANGIGAAISRRLLASGVRLAAIDLVPAEFDNARENVKSYLCDVSDGARVLEVCGEILRDFGAPDILVNNAGGSGPEVVTDIEQVTDEIWSRMMDLNLTSAMRFCRAFAGGMRDKRYGRIVNMSSTLRYGISGPNTSNCRLPYVTAKAALVGLTSQLAKDLASFGVTVNAVSPGLTFPDPQAKITRRFEELPDARKQQILSRLPAGRAGTGAEIAELVHFLVSPGASYVSGETINARGG